MNTPSASARNSSLKPGQTAVPGTKKYETEKAILWLCEARDEESDLPLELWFPLSTVHAIHPDHLVVDTWIAESKGLV